MGLGAATGLDAVAHISEWGTISGTNIHDWVAGKIWSGAQPHNANREKLLEQLFGGRGTPPKLIPASNHWYKLPKDMEWYGIETDCCDAYRSEFGYSQAKLVNGSITVEPEDTAVYFGSQRANAGVEFLLGEAARPTPVFEIQLPNHDWRARLRWNLHVPPGARNIHMTQYGAPWQETEQYIVERETGNRYPSGRAWDEDRSAALEPLLVGPLKEDYLLVTSLPRVSRQMDSRNIIFGGLWGAGTASSKNLLSELTGDELENLKAKVHHQPHYQALYHVDVSVDDKGEMQPSGITLVDAVALEFC